MDTPLEPATSADRLGTPDAAIVRPAPGDPARLEAFLPSPCVQNHAANIMPLGNGDLGCVWFGGSAAGVTERRASLYDDIEGESDGAALPEPAATNESGERTAFWGAPRAPMTLAVSEDGGRSWPYERDLEIGDGYCMTNNSREKLNREYSYPSIKQGPDGMLHIAFTYFRQAIKYVRVAEDWVRR